MRSGHESDRLDLARMIAGALYQGIFINILIPAALLIAAYFIDQRGGIDNSIGSMANPLFYVLAVISIAEGAVAVLWRTKSLGQPMVRRRETMQEDIRGELSRRLRPIFLLIAAIALNGFLYFLLTGRFDETLAFVVLSFIAFQVVRPRYGMMRKVLEDQRALMESGQFMQG